MALAFQATAQTSSGEIQLTVTDASGAVVTNAEVTVTGAETGNVARSLVTNGQGIATAPLLKPGPYDISISASGFDKLIHKGIVVHVGDVLDLRFTLQTGSTSTAVTVVGQAPLVEEKSGTNFDLAGRG